ncbi:MAG: redoxin domain-containing protein [Candidatus Sericytochromatia bacterium]|nr:redoxin domain-containing protein [Candidatus Sericytochromatia bacterium]
MPRLSRSVHFLLPIASAVLLAAGCARVPQASAPRTGTPGALTTLASRPEEPTTHLPVGTQAPDMPITRLDGTLESFAAYRGKPVLLVFWATWCPICTNELPAKQAMHDEFNAKGLQVLCVNASNEKLQRLRDFIAWQGYTMPVFGQYTGAATRDYLVSNIPTLYWVDRQGRITDAHVGPLPIDDLRQRTRKLLKLR